MTPGSAALKPELRKAAFARRAAAHARATALIPAATERLLAVLGPARPRCVAGYWPIRTEIDPRPALEALHAQGVTLCLPEVTGPARPLRFRRWAPGAEMLPGAYGAAIPADETAAVPDALILPLAAFDRSGARLGYGGGFYDRTLEALRAEGPALAVGFAFAAQESPEPLPVEPTDAPMDALVTEAETLRFGG